LDELRLLPEVTAKKLEVVINARAHEMGSMTMPALDGKLSALFAEFMTLVDKRLPAASTAPTQIDDPGETLEENPNNTAHPWKTFGWDILDEHGDVVKWMESSVPPSFAWMDEELRVIFRKWFFGHPRLGIVPFRDLNKQHFPVRTHAEYYKQATVIAHLAASKHPKSRLPPADKENRARRAKTQVSRYNDCSRLINRMLTEAASADPTIAELIARINTVDPKGYQLPSGEMTRVIPTVLEERVLYKAARATLDKVDNYDAQDTSKSTRYLTRPDQRNVSTWEGLCQKAAKRLRIENENATLELQ
jgi:hypothetical protein